MWVCVYTLVRASILAPLSSSNRTMLLFPRLDATCRGVMSFCGERKVSIHQPATELSRVLPPTYNNINVFNIEYPHTICWSDAKSLTNDIMQDLWCETKKQWLMVMKPYQAYWTTFLLHISCLKCSNSVGVKLLCYLTEQEDKGSASSCTGK